MKNLLLAKMQMVLEAVSASGIITINELSEKLDIPLPTLSRLISDMAEMQLIEKLDYYRVAPAAGMIRMGECAKRHSYLVQIASPMLQSYAEQRQMGVILAAFDQNSMFTLFEFGTENIGQNRIWETGLAMVLLERYGVDNAGAVALYRENVPGGSDTDIIIFEREMDQIRQNRMLFRTNTMRQWSCSHSFVYRGLVCGFCFYGHAPENCSRERFDLDCSMILSRITSALN